MQTTSNYGLKKPDLTDVVDIQNFNDNADIIDSELSKRALKTDITVTSVAGRTGAVTLSKSDVGLGNVNNWGVSTAVNNTSTTTYATTSAVKQAYDKAVEVFNSSTDGKKKLAQAITTKGVATSASDTFSTMVANINKIPTMTIDGQSASSDLSLRSLKNKYIKAVNTPYSCEACSIIEYKNELHMLGGTRSGVENYHYKWSGTSWTRVSTIPYYFSHGTTIVYNNEIHILGGTTLHYKWNGSSWTSVSTIPYQFRGGSTVLYNNDIHAIGSAYNAYSPSDNTKKYGKYHYKWNGASWTSVSTLPFIFHDGSVLMYQNEMHMLGGNNDGYASYHYKWNGSSWVTVSTLKFNGYRNHSVIYNNQIHMLGSYVQREYCIWNGTEWIQTDNIISSSPKGCIVYNNKIMLIYDGIIYIVYHNCCMLR